MKMLLGLILMSSSLSLAASQDLPTVDHVDLTRYQGTWYEIAAIPQYFQRKCIGGTTAVYQILSNDEVRVDNSCDTKDEGRTASEGRAKVVDHETNAKLKVTFVNIGKHYFYTLGGKYWIINLADDYSYAVIGHPNRKYGWILSRHPSLPAETLRELTGFLKEQDYNVCEFMTTPQKGGFESRKSLCDK